MLNDPVPGTLASSLLVLLGGSCLLAQAAPPPGLAGKRVLILGDSITENGTHVSMIEYYLQTTSPDAAFDIISIGLSSETVSGLSEKQHPFPRPCVHERLGRALEKTRPALVVACYGMNDGIYHPQSPDRMKAYQDGVTKLVNAATAAGAQVVLQTPPPFDPSTVGKPLPGAQAPDFSYVTPYAKYDSVLEDYRRWIMGLKRPGVSSVDLHKAMTAELKKRRLKDPAFCLSPDGIHPAAAGHLLMARTFLKTMGIALPDADLERELKRVTEDPLFMLIDKRRKARSAGWLSFVGYTKDVTVQTDSVTATEAEAAALQQQIDALKRSPGRK